MKIYEEGYEHWPANVRPIRPVVWWMIVIFITSWIGAGGIFIMLDKPQYALPMLFIPIGACLIYSATSKDMTNNTIVIPPKTVKPMREQDSQCFSCLHCRNRGLSTRAIYVNGQYQGILDPYCDCKAGKELEKRKRSR